MNREKRGPGKVAIGDEGRLRLDLPEGRLGATHPRFQILALTGGGFRGLFTAQVLNWLEARAGRPLAQCFDLLAGTSVGGILALALASNCKSEALSKAVEDHGPELFGGWRPIKAVRRLRRATYSSDALARLVRKVVGEKADSLLSDLEVPVVVPTVSQTSGKPRLLRSKGLAGDRADQVTLLDAALATAAAPTYFPPHLVDRENLIDGGLIANAPDLVAVAESVRGLPVLLDQISVLSIGTAAPVSQGAVRSLGSLGLFAWSRRLVQLTMQSQEALVVNQCRYVLGDRYKRLDFKPSESQAKVLGLDRATPEAIETLTYLAGQLIKHLEGDDRLGAFLAHQTQR